MATRKSLEQDLSGSTAKRKREILKQDMDDSTAKRKRSAVHLSDLPTDILCGIISQLPLKQAARTSILSSHWQKIWCSRANLNFTLYSMLPRRCIESDWSLNEDLFIKTVSEVFEQHSGLGVHKIAIKFGLDSRHAYHIDRWLNFAIATKTKDLTFDFKSTLCEEAPYDFPFKLFGTTSSSRLQSVSLRSVSLKPPVDFKAFLNLKRLKLEETNVSDEDMQILISNCNTLEFLGIVDCTMLTRLSTSHLSNQLKHLQVENCPLLKEIKLNFGLTKLEYRGPLIPLAPPEPLLLTNVCMKLYDVHASLEYIFTNLPSTLPRLVMLTVTCSEFERTILPENHVKFMYLKHVRLQLRLPVLKGKSDLLDFACVLECAPLLEKLELHMWMTIYRHPDRKEARCKLRYRKEAHGELRTLPSQPHAHLRLVHITGFNGMKDQVELALHILRNSILLREMKIDTKPLIPCRPPYDGYEHFDGYQVDGYEVAMKYLSKADHRDVVDVSEVRRQ